MIANERTVTVELVEEGGRHCDDLIEEYAEQKHRWTLHRYQRSIHNASMSLRW